MLARPATLRRSPPNRSIEHPSMGLLRRPTPGEVVEDGRLGRPYGPGAHSRASQKTRLRLRRESRIQLPYQQSSMVGASPLSGRSPPANVAASATGTTPQPCHPTPPAWQAATRMMPATSSGPGGRLASSMRADTAPNHPIRVRTAHSGWAHAGRQPAGWAKAARSRGERRAGQGRRRGLPLRLSAAWRARWHDGCAAPTGVFSILGRSRGGRKGNHFAAWQEPNLCTERSAQRSAPALARRSS